MNRMELMLYRVYKRTGKLPICSLDEVKEGELERDELIGLLHLSCLCWDNDEFERIVEWLIRYGKKVKGVSST